jgi:hypothetical protein
LDFPWWTFASFAVDEVQMSFGACHSPHWASSSAATASTSSSPHGRATICTPMGKPYEACAKLCASFASHALYFYRTLDA